MTSVGSVAARRTNQNRSASPPPPPIVPSRAKRRRPFVVAHPRVPVVTLAQRWQRPPRRSRPAEVVLHVAQVASQLGVVVMADDHPRVAVQIAPAKQRPVVAAVEKPQGHAQPVPRGVQGGLFQDQLGRLRIDVRAKCSTVSVPAAAQEQQAGKEVLLDRHAIRCRLPPECRAPDPIPDGDHAAPWQNRAGSQGRRQIVSASNSSTSSVVDEVPQPQLEQGWRLSGKPARR